MSLIITNDDNYKNIANAVRNKLCVDTEYKPSELAAAINTIPSSSDGTNNFKGILWTKIDENTKKPLSLKIVGYAGTLRSFNQDCYSLVEKIDFQCPEVHTIDSQAFNNLSNLEELTIPGYIKNVNYAAFNLCSHLKKVKIEHGVENLGQYVFQTCPIETLYLPNTLVSVNNSIRTNELKKVTLENEINCNNLSFVNATHLTAETLVAMLTALKDRTNEDVQYTFTLGSTNINKLTDEQKAIATNKNWILA